MSVTTKKFKDLQCGDKFVFNSKGETFAALKITTRTADVVVGEDIDGELIWQKKHFKADQEFLTSPQIVLC